MKTEEPALAEKLPIYMMTWSLPPAFVVLAVVVLALDSFNEAGVAVIKGGYMFLLVVGGTLLNLWLYFVRRLKLKCKLSRLHIRAHYFRLPTPVSMMAQPRLLSERYAWRGFLTACYQPGGLSRWCELGC